MFENSCKPPGCLSNLPYKFLLIVLRSNCKTVNTYCSWTVAMSETSKLVVLAMLLISYVNCIGLNNLLIVLPAIKPFNNFNLKGISFHPKILPAMIESICFKY